jgi:hypothetical protein
VGRRTKGSNDEKTRLFRERWRGCIARSCPFVAHAVGARADATERLAKLCINRILLCLRVSLEQHDPRENLSSEGSYCMIPVLSRPLAKRRYHRI